MTGTVTLIVYRQHGLLPLWRWTAVAGNNRKVGASEQGYRSKWYCKRKARRAYPDGIIKEAKS